MPRPTVKEFLTDPKHKEEAEYAREMNREIMREELERSRAKPEDGVFGFLFPKTKPGSGFKFPWEE